MEKLRDDEKIREMFEKAFKLLKENKINEADYVIYEELDVELYDYSVNLISTQSTEKELIDLSKLVKKVFDLLEDSNKETIQELSSCDDNVGIIREVEMNNQKNKLSPEDFQIWLSEHNYNDNFTETSF